MRKFVLLIAATVALALASTAAADPVSQTIFETNNGTVTVTVTNDDVTGEITGLAWVVPSGTLTMTIDRIGQPDLTFTRTSSGSLNVPANRFFLVKDRGGAWSWRGTAYSIGWHP